MEKLKEVLETILLVILNIIEFTFVILEMPYIYIGSALIGAGKIDVLYCWLPVNGVTTVWLNYSTDKIEYSIDGHILIKKLFKK